MTMNRNLPITAAIVSIALFGLSGIATADKPADNAAQSKPAQSAPANADKLQQHREVPDDPYVKPPQGRLTTPGAVIVRGEHTSVQANVNAEGNNIIGDAAHEPSIAPIPTTSSSAGASSTPSTTTSDRPAGRIRRTTAEPGTSPA